MSSKNLKINFFGTMQEHKYLKKELITSFEKTLISGQSLQGKQVQNFEKKFALMHKRKFAIAVNSCTDALYFALLSLDLKKNDEILVPSYSFLATATCIARIGAKPVFVDVNDEGLLDLKKAKKKLTKKTRAIVYVNLFGLFQKPKEILSFARLNNLFLIEDNAQAMGAENNGYISGSIGYISCFSFDPTKVLSAVGSGGMILTNSQKVKKKVESLRYHGKSIKGSFDELGFNSQMPTLIASALLVKLKYYKQFRKKRILIAKQYISGLKDLPIELPKYNKNLENIYHKFVIKIKYRDSLKMFLEKKGISCMIHYKYILPNLKIFKNLKKDSFNNSITLSKTSLSLPIHPFLSKKEINYIILQIHNFFKSIKPHV